MLMSQIIFSNNNCILGLGCILLRDCSLSLVNNSTFRDNIIGDYQLILFERTLDGSSLILSTDICIKNIYHNNNIGNTFIYILNHTDFDLITITSSIFEYSLNSGNNGLYFNLDSLHFNTKSVYSSIIFHNTNNDNINANYYLNLNLTYSII